MMKLLMLQTTGIYFVARLVYSSWTSSYVYDLEANSMADDAYLLLFC